MSLVLPSFLSLYLLFLFALFSSLLFSSLSSFFFFFPLFSLSFLSKLPHSSPSFFPLFSLSFLPQFPPSFIPLFSHFPLSFRTCYLSSLSYLLFFFLVYSTIFCSSLPHWLSITLREVLLLTECANGYVLVVHSLYLHLFNHQSYPLSI